MSSNSIPNLTALIRDQKEMLIANAVMLGEIPAPTGGEEQRIRFLADRFMQSELQDISIDEKLNVTGMIHGTEGKHQILLAAHADTPLFTSPEQRLTINVAEDSLTGQGLADNTLGLATIAFLPDLLKALGIRLKSNLVLLGHTKSLSGADLEGFQFFLKNFRRKIHAGIVVEGISLGRLNFSCLGMVQADISCRVHQEPGTRWEAAENSIIILHRAIQRILEIPIPQEPKTSVIIGSIRAGKTFNRPPEIARLRLEIRSEKPGKAREIRIRITEILEELAAETASECTITFPALRKPGGIPFSHPLVSTVREVQQGLGIQPILGPSFSDLSAFIRHQIPAVTLGLTKAKHVNEAAETLELEPLYLGLTQLILILQKIDNAPFLTLDNEKI